MTLKGKGFFIWKIHDCEGSSPKGIAEAAQAAGLTHVLIKVADGNYPFNIDLKTKVDLVPPVVEALRALGIAVWGWQYIYGYDPSGEARIAIRRIQQFNLDGFVIDAEGEFKEPGRAAAAKRYILDLHKSCPNLPLALSSYRFPTYHPQLPWREFLDLCDYNMPQVYWEKAHNPADQLARCVREFQALTPGRPVIPTGPTYKNNGWRPTDEDFKSFFETVQNLKLEAANFFSWDECKRDLPNLWEAVRTWDWENGQHPTDQDLPNQYITALNQHDLSAILKLYRPDAVHVTSRRTVQGYEALKVWYIEMFAQIPDATFTINHVMGSGTSRHFAWRANCTNGTTQEGNDTIGLMDGKITYHYTQFNVQI